MMYGSWTHARIFGMPSAVTISCSRSSIAKDWYGWFAASIGTYCQVPPNRLSIVLGKSLRCREECEIEHFVFGTAAGEVVHRLIQTLKDRAVCFKAAETLCNLVADVARFEGREYEDVCTAFQDRKSTRLNSSHV